MARSLLKSGYDSISILPNVKLAGEELNVDVAAQRGDKTVLALVEPESATEETEAKLKSLRATEQAEVIILHSQYGDPGNIPDDFAEELESGQFRLMAVVPPPFDDVYEYDIWMFETTFRNVLEQ